LGTSGNLTRPQEAEMAHFSDRLFSVNKLIIAAAVIYTGAVTFAHAAQAQEATCEQRISTVKNDDDMAREFVVKAKTPMFLAKSKQDQLTEWQSSLATYIHFQIPEVLALSTAQCPNITADWIRQEQAYVLAFIHSTSETAEDLLADMYNHRASN
jgi:hypothetical protein